MSGSSPNPKAKKASRAEAECSFRSLPTELVDLILSKLSLSDKKTARQVCSLWNTSIEWTLHYNFPLSCATRPAFQARAYELSRLTVDLANLFWPKGLSPNVKSSLSSVQKIHLNAKKQIDGGKNEKKNMFVDYKGLRTLLQNCTRLQWLEIGFAGLDFFATSSRLDLKGFKLEHLTQLRMWIHNNTATGLVLGMLRLETPSLRKLTINRIRITKENWEVYVAIQACLVRNKKTLKSLTLQDAETTVTSSVITKDLDPNLATGLRDLKLEVLMLEQWAECNETLPFLSHILANQTVLQELDINSNSPAIYGPLSALLLRNRETLTKLSLGHPCSVDVDYALLARLPRLSHFEFNSCCSSLDLANIPRQIRSLVWNSSLGQEWYEADRKFPDLKTLTLDLRALEQLEPVHLSILCPAVFGSTENKTSLDTLSLVRNTMEIVRQPRWEEDIYYLETIAALGAQGYEIDRDDDFVRIIRR